MLVIEAKNLSKTYGYYEKQSWLGRRKKEVQAVRGVSFVIEQGEFVGFIGPNGAGKTTTLKMLAGVLYPTTGEAKVLGFTPWQRQTEYQKQMAFVMGNKNQLWWDLPPIDSFVLNKEIYEIDDGAFRDRLDELTGFLNIKHVMTVPVRKLSLGERMKCELTAALLHDPKVLFLDEPTIGLDVVSQKAMRDFLTTWNRSRNTTILLTSHYMQDIKELTRRVITIDHGRIIFDGFLNELIKKYVAEKIIKIFFRKKIEIEDLEKYGKVLKREESYAELIVPRDEATRVTREILSILPVDDLLVEEVEIEEVVRLIFERGR